MIEGIIMNKVLSCDYYIGQCLVAPNCAAFLLAIPPQAGVERTQNAGPQALAAKMFSWLKFPTFLRPENVP